MMGAEDPVSPSTALGGRRLADARTDDRQGQRDVSSPFPPRVPVSAIQRVVDRGDLADAEKATWPVLHCGDQGKGQGDAVTGTVEANLLDASANSTPGGTNREVVVGIRSRNVAVEVENPLFTVDELCLRDVDGVVISGNGRRWGRRPPPTSSYSIGPSHPCSTSAAVLVDTCWRSPAEAWLHSDSTSRRLPSVSPGLGEQRSSSDPSSSLWRSPEPGAQRCCWTATSASGVTHARCWLE